MRILAATDFHGDSDAFQMTARKAKRTNAQVVIVCGDITHFGTLQEARRLLSNLHDLEAHVLFIPGNCDPVSLAKEKLEKPVSIHGKCRTIGNITVLGIGGSSPTPFSTPFELGEVEIAEILEQSSSRCPSLDNFILVSHSPPKNSKVDMTYTRQHVGSLSIREFIEKAKPRLVLCGHIHEAKGIDKINEVIIVNPGPARHGHCALINFNKCIDVKLDHL